jgi:hypothetical protein
LAGHQARCTEDKEAANYGGLAILRPSLAALAATTAAQRPDRMRGATRVIFSRIAGSTYFFSHRAEAHEQRYGLP